MSFIPRSVRNLFSSKQKKNTPTSRGRQCRIEQLESKTVLSVAPTIGSFGVLGTEETIPAFKLGDKIQLVAKDVVDADGVLKSVAFWWDANGNDSFDLSDDKIVLDSSTVDPKPSSDFYLSVSEFTTLFDTALDQVPLLEVAAPSAGRNTVFVVATDNENNVTVEALSIDLLSVDLQAFDAVGNTSGIGDGLPLFVNTDDDTGTAPGNDSADEIFDGGDDDLGRIRITQLPTGLDAGTLTLSTDDAAKIRVFTPITSDVVDLSSPITLDLANPSGVLASAVTGDLDLFVEGIATTGSDPVMVTLKLEHAAGGIAIL